MYPQDLRENWHAGQGRWKDVPAAEWNDWHWQLRNRITTLAQLEEMLEQANYPLSELDIEPFGERDLEISAVLLATSIDGDELDALMVKLGIGVKVATLPR